MPALARRQMLPMLFIISLLAVSCTDERVLSPQIDLHESLQSDLIGRTVSVVNGQLVFGGPCDPEPQAVAVSGDLIMLSGCIEPPSDPEDPELPEGGFCGQLASAYFVSDCQVMDMELRSSIMNYFDDVNYRNDTNCLRMKNAMASTLFAGDSTALTGPIVNASQRGAAIVHEVTGAPLAVWLSNELINGSFGTLERLRVIGHEAYHLAFGLDQSEGNDNRADMAAYYCFGIPGASPPW